MAKTFDELWAVIQPGINDREWGEPFSPEELEAIEQLRDACEVRARANAEHVSCARLMGSLAFRERTPDEEVECLKAIGATQAVRRILGRPDSEGE